MHEIPIGVSNFRTLIEYSNSTGNGYLYIDKSLFIKEVLFNGSKTIVINRPRIFGQTFNLSML